jgi:hypothetical protein
MKALNLVGWFALLVGVITLALVGCSEPKPVSVDAPQLASALKWVGVCAVVCSVFGAIALITASNNRRK